MPPYGDKNKPAGALIGKDRVGWPEEIRVEFERNAFNGRVGQRLLSESERVRVWQISLAPGERVAAHRHVLDYFWTALTSGTSIQRTDDGTTRAVEYTAGDTRHFHFDKGEYLLHDLENTSDHELAFLTVEFLGGTNNPLSTTE